MFVFVSVEFEFDTSWDGSVWTIEAETFWEELRLEDRLLLTVVIVTPSPWYSACRIFWWLLRLWLEKEEKEIWRFISIRLSYFHSFVVLDMRTKFEVSNGEKKSSNSISQPLVTCILFWTRTCRNGIEAQLHTLSFHVFANCTLFYRIFRIFDTYRN